MTSILELDSYNLDNYHQFLELFTICLVVKLKPRISHT
jgi:hypothetical protein